MFATDPYNQLATFEDVIKAFEKYEKGGFWIKKIIQHLGVFRESVMGPYTLKEAERLAKRWTEIFKFEGKEVVKVLSFRELVCGSSQDLPICEENLWNPPKGSSLICLIHNFYPFSVFKKETISNSQFRKFEVYAESHGIKKISNHEKTIFVFYNSRNTNSYRRAHIMKRFLNEKRSEGFDWIVDEIKGDKHPEDQRRPTLIPGYISRLNKECYPVTLDYFKELYDPPDQKKRKNYREKLKKTFNKLRKCTPDQNKTYVYKNDIEYQVIEVDLLLNTDDTEVRKLLFERSQEATFNLILTNFEGSFSVGVYEIGKEARMIIHMDRVELDEKEESYISKKLASHFITRLDVIGAILLFICKCFGIEKIYIDDDLKEDCQCGAKEVSLFANGIRYLAGERNIYHNLGFQYSSDEDEELEEYQDMEIPILDDEDETKMKVKDLANMYLRKNCSYENICQVLSQVTDSLSEKMKGRYVLNLEEVELGYYKLFF
jgi:hypothetical protein